MISEPFQLTEDAIADIDGVWLYLLEKEGLETADRTVTELFKAFYRLSEIPNIGHRRADLTAKPVLFYTVFSYLILYVPGSHPIQILAILHGKRDLQSLLKQRL